MKAINAKNITHMKKKNRKGITALTALEINTDISPNASKARI